MKTSPLFAGAFFLIALVPGRAANAQSTSTVSSLTLSPGAELGLSLYGASGTSDHINVINAFNFSSASTASSTFIVGFSHGDTVVLTPGTVFNLMTFGSTNFADASQFRAVPRDTLTTVDGDFTLIAPNQATGEQGRLRFTLRGAAEMPEPSALLLLLPALLLVGGCRRGRVEHL